MQRNVGGKALEPEKNKHYTEFTLGPAMLLGVLFGLFLLCAVFFEMGYRAGQHSAPQTGSALTQSSTGQTLTSEPDNPLSKPPAKSTITTAPAQAPVAEVQQTVAEDGTPSGNPLTSYAPVGASSNGATAQAQVRSALPAQANASQGSATVGGMQVQPALPRSAGIMVQIAAVSRSEDADGLMSALRRRGYAVTARREPGDSLIHIQIGPFATHNDANAVSQKLLSDGYNAVVMP